MLPLVQYFRPILCLRSQSRILFLLFMEFLIPSIRQTIAINIQNKRWCQSLKYVIRKIMIDWFSIIVCLFLII